MKTKTCSSSKAKAATVFPAACIHESRQAGRKCQTRRSEANREKRQELARLRQEAKLHQAGQPVHPSKVASRGRLKGKGLFYCASPAARAKEIQRRLSEANPEHLKGSRP